MIEFCEDTERTAAKEHDCGECGTTIWVGDKYWDFRWVYDGRWCGMKRCSACTRLIERQSPDAEGGIAPIAEWMWGTHDMQQVADDEELLAFELRHLRARAGVINKDDEFAMSKMASVIGDYEALCDCLLNRVKMGEV